MDQFNPGLQKLVVLGNSYVKAFQALALSSEANFSFLAKMGEQALNTLSSRSLGSNPFGTVKLRPTVTHDKSAPRIH